jgi:tRNA nucleotidyltransferase (CCA-adding enzyme)
VLCHLRPRALHDANASDSAVRRLARQVKRIDRLVRVARADFGGCPPKPFDGFPAGTWLLERARRLEVEDRAPPRLSWVAICWNWESSQALIWDGCSMNVTKRN